MNILVMNLGSTSTKLGIYQDQAAPLTTTLRHSKQELSPYPSDLAQEDFRRGKILDFLRERGLSPADFDVIATRGGLIRPIPGGVFMVDDEVVRDAKSGRYGRHSANTGLLIAHKWSQEYGIPAIFADAPVSDELTDLARVSGFAGIKRRSVFHALNVKRVARQYCEESGIPYQDSRLIVAHLGGGVSVTALLGMKAIDVNGATDGDGPFSPERAGSLPIKQALQVAYQQAKTPEDAFDLFYKKGGLMSYFGTNDVADLVTKAQTDEETKLVLSAMVYQIAKQVAAMAVPLLGQVQQIIVTGGIAYNTGLMEELKEKIEWLAPVTVYPGEDELAALAENARMFLLKQVKARYIHE